MNSLRKSLALCLLLYGAAFAALAGDSPGDRFLYLPPAWADRVLFYHSFESGPDKPEIDRLEARLPRHSTNAVGFTGQGCATPLGPAKKDPFTLVSPALSAHRPLTLMCWFQLTASMQETTGFNLLSLRGDGPYLTWFIAGKGPWCDLKEPTFIYQVVNFPGIPLYHNSWGGRAWFEVGQWHHAALTVANAAEIRMYLDGVLRETIMPKGRAFKEHETHTAVFGSQDHPVVIDEILVIDRALAPTEISHYVLATQRLREQQLPIQLNR